MSRTLKSRLAHARELARTTRSTIDQSVSANETPGTELVAEAKPGVDSHGTSTELFSSWREITPFLLSRSMWRKNPLPDYLDLRPYSGRSTGKSVGSGTELKNTEMDQGTELCSFPSERMVFFDLETTGLSGGTGTIAFLAALGRVVHGSSETRFEIRQYFLKDYPGEGDFLDAVLGQLRPGDVLASYNGRSFDEPLLRTRCVLNRRTWPLLRHVDFLHAARRLWRGRFPDCSLGTLERLLLDRDRGVDVPSARIPEIWFQFIRQGAHPLMAVVMDHNVADIESLAEVAAVCSRIHSDPIGARECDLCSLGTLWLGLNADIGMSILKRAFSSGDERAGWVLLKHYRHQGDRAEYERILGALPPCWDSWIERAKHAEHRCHDAHEAMKAVLQASVFVDSEVSRMALDRRLGRLKRKMASTVPPEGRTGRRH